MDAILNMLRGFSVTREVYANPRKYDRAIGGGFARDAAALRGDVRVVGRDVQAALVRREAGSSGQTNSGPSPVKRR